MIGVPVIWFIPTETQYDVEGLTEKLRCTWIWMTTLPQVPRRKDRQNFGPDVKEETKKGKQSPPEIQEVTRGWCGVLHPLDGADGKCYQGQALWHFQVEFCNCVRNVVHRSDVHVEWKRDYGDQWDSEQSEERQKGVLTNYNAARRPSAKAFELCLLNLRERFFDRFAAR